MTTKQGRYRYSWRERYAPPQCPATHPDTGARCHLDTGHDRVYPTHVSIDDRDHVHRWETP